MICGALALDLLGFSGCYQKRSLISCLVGGIGLANIGYLKHSSVMFDVDNVEGAKLSYV